MNTLWRVFVLALGLAFCRDLSFDLGGRHGGLLAAEDAPRSSDERYLAPYVFVATGSGVVVSADGEILTNHHVIASVCSPLSPTLTVRLANLGECAAVLIAMDPVGDLALLRLTGQHPSLTPAILADHLPAPGTPVIAVGNPFALGDMDDRPSVSRGVLGTGRVVRGSYVDCLQHDAPVNPGNSGGPLFDLDGRLLGINGAIRSRSGFRINSGIGLAVAATQLALFVPALRRAGSEHGGWLVRSNAPTDLVLEQRPDGVTVVSGPQPLRTGDLIRSVAGRAAPAVATAMGLFNSLPWESGQSIAVVVRRDGAEVMLAIATARAIIPGKPWHGLVGSERDGRVVLDLVEAQSPVGQAGVLAGDVLLAVNGAVIASRLDLLRATATLSIGDPLNVTVRTPSATERRLRCFVARIEP